LPEKAVVRRLYELPQIKQQVNSNNQVAKLAMSGALAIIDAGF
jgi:hypothetical protein